VRDGRGACLYTNGCACQISNSAWAARLDQRRVSGARAPALFENGIRELLLFYYMRMASSAGNSDR
jgi:hypothetical protein